MLLLLLKKKKLEQQQHKKPEEERKGGPSSYPKLKLHFCGSVKTTNNQPKNPPKKTGKQVQTSLTCTDYLS